MCRLQLLEDRNEDIVNYRNSVSGTTTSVL
jgi:hypothetical protein